MGRFLSTTQISCCAIRYGGEHKAKELQKEAIYGLTEMFRDEVRAARLVANPGCYPTSVQLPLMPLLKVHSFLLVKLSRAPKAPVVLRKLTVGTV